MPLLVHVDRASGLPVPKPRPVRYERPALGDLVHVDIKKLERIRDGGAWRVHGRVFAQGRAASSRRSQAARARAAGSRGYRYLHHAVDAYSRVVCSKILDDERNQSAAGFWTLANAFFQSLGVTVTAVMTDNGSCYRSCVFNEAFTGKVKHRYTRP